MGIAEAGFPDLSIAHANALGGPAFTVSRYLNSFCLFQPLTWKFLSLLQNSMLRVRSLLTGNLCLSGHPPPVMLLITCLYVGNTKDTQTAGFPQLLPRQSVIEAQFSHLKRLPLRSSKYSEHPHCLPRCYEAIAGSQPRRWPESTNTNIACMPCPSGFTRRLLFCGYEPSFALHSEN